LDERVQIEKHLDQGLSLRHSARLLGRDPATVSREVKRNSWRPANTSSAYTPYRPKRLKTDSWTGLQYRASLAHPKANQRAANSHKPRKMTTDWMVDYIVKGLEKGWSPQSISGRLGRDYPADRSKQVSPETVYAWIYSPTQAHRRLWEYLPRGHKRRRKRSGRRVHSTKIDRRVSIRHRPEGCDNRTEFGHWEGDSVIGTRGAAALHTETERTTRFLAVRKVQAVTCEQAIEAQSDIFAALPQAARLSVTTDNGAEFHHHYELADQLGMATFFADPYSAYQRGTNEHFNGRIRRYLPKGTTFEDLTEDELTAIVQEINNQPRKVLSWATPTEAFNQQLASLHTTTHCASN
jgi:IS30 family transposase